jgi:hypothetical protein
MLEMNEARLLTGGACQTRLYTIVPKKKKKKTGLYIFGLSILSGKSQSACKFSSKDYALTGCIHEHK